jgi:hypothetical protein
LSIELNGEYNRAARLLGEYGTVPADLGARLMELAGLPVDLRPRYTILYER